MGGALECTQAAFGLTISAFLPFLQCGCTADRVRSLRCGYSPVANNTLAAQPLSRPIVVLGHQAQSLASYKNETEGSMRRHGLKVRIIGAGTGGLCLAQGLKKDHVEVEVYERDRSPSDRLQGYRLSISETGRRALKACLPEALLEKLIENSAKPSETVSFLDHSLNRLLVIERLHSDRKDETSELPISRIALRHLLIEGLDGIILYGKKFVAFEDAAQDAVTARFEDGSSTTGDVLIGADGAGSRLRAQLLPHARRIETGVVAVSGKVSLNDDVRRATPQAILRGPTLILGPRGCFMFSSTVDYEAAAGSGRHYDRERYVMWGFSAHDDTLYLTGDVDAISGQDAIAAVVALMDNWHPALRRLDYRRVHGYRFSGKDIGTDPAVADAEGNAARRRTPQYDAISRNRRQYRFAGCRSASPGSCHGGSRGGRPDPSTRRLRTGHDQVRIHGCANFTQGHGALSRKRNRGKNRHESRFPSGR